MRKTIFIIFLGIFSTASSQVPGYLGKRLSVTANYCMGVPTRTLPASYKSIPIDIYDQENFTYKLNVPKVLNFKLNYVVSEKRELEVSLRTGNLGLANVFAYKYFPSSTYNYQTDYTSLNLHYTAIGISLRKTYNEMISPLGAYTSFGVSYNMATLNDPGHSYMDHGLSFIRGKAKFYDFHLGLGVNTIFFDRVILSLGADSYLNSYVLKLIPSDEVVVLTDEQVLKGRIFYSNYFSVSLGVGYLIF